MDAINEKSKIPIRCGIDSTISIIQSLTGDIKDLTQELSKMHSDMNLLCYRVDEHSKVVSTVNNMASKLQEAERCIEDMEEEIEEILEWMKKSKSEEEKTRSVLERTEEARIRVEDENSKRRWGFWTATAAGIIALLSQIAQWIFSGGR